MTTLFDRYVLGRYAHTYLILFVSIYGLFVVFDGFTNMDEFQEGSHSTVETITRMAKHYSFQSSAFFGMIGAIVGVTSTMIVFGLLQKNSEIAPMLAAGVPVYRIIVPALMGMALVNVMLILNQELLIPSISHHLLAPRNSSKQVQKQLDPVNDPATGVHISGSRLIVNDGTIEDVVFTLKANETAKALMTITSPKAYYQPESETSPSGWVLKNVEPTVDEVLDELTEKGRRFVTRTADGEGLFILTSLDFMELYNRNQTAQFATTRDLLKRVKAPAGNPLALRMQEMNLHSRLTAPILNILAILVAIPLVLRKESRGLIGNLALSATVLGLLFAVAQASFFLGRANLIEPDIAAWTPVVMTGSCAAWVSGYIQS
ncbi:MAG: LptF/LptG family permease [Planctomycetaceae bacterium]|nr:LptF/LptG family permease [Planctomycetaceae bacterium]